MTMKHPEIIDIVNSKDRIVGKEKRSIAIQKGLYHRAANVLVINSRGKIFLQQRSSKADICPLTWDISTSEHVKAGESYEEAARRGLKEELGIKAAVSKLKDVHLQKSEYFNGRIKEYEFIVLFVAKFDGKINVNKKEAETGKFFTKEEITKMVADGAGKFTPWFLDKWKWIEKNKKIAKLI